MFMGMVIIGAPHLNSQTAVFVQVVAFVAGIVAAWMES